MSSAIAPLPNGAGVTVIADRHPQQGGSRSDADERGDRQNPRNPGNDAETRATPVLAAEASSFAPEDDPVPAETLFAVTLLASSLPQPTVLPEALRHPPGADWAPPDSPLHLKDKTI